MRLCVCARSAQNHMRAQSHEHSTYQPIKSINQFSFGAKHANSNPNNKHTHTHKHAFPSTNSRSSASSIAVAAFARTQPSPTRNPLLTATPTTQQHNTNNRLWPKKESGGTMDARQRLAEVVAFVDEELRFASLVQQVQVRCEVCVCVLPFCFLAPPFNVLMVFLPLYRFFFLFLFLFVFCTKDSRKRAVDLICNTQGNDHPLKVRFGEWGKFAKEHWDPFAFSLLPLTPNPKNLGNVCLLRRSLSPSRWTLLNDSKAFGHNSWKKT